MEKEFQREAVCLMHKNLYWCKFAIRLTLLGQCEYHSFEQHPYQCFWQAVINLIWHSPCFQIA